MPERHGPNNPFVVTATFNIKSKKESIENSILRAIPKAIGYDFQLAAKKSTVEIRRLFKDAIERQPEWQSLKGAYGKTYGQTLLAQFGLRNPEMKLDEILTTWIKSIRAVGKNITRVGGTKTFFKGGIELHGIRGDFKDVLALGAAVQYTEKGIKPQPLKWLQWLLVNGDTFVISGYKTETDPIHSSKSRSETNTIMVKEKSAIWRVPPEFAGNIKDNFATRAMEEIQDDIIKILKKNIRGY